MKDLACPYCGSTVFVSHVDRFERVTLECDNIQCNAQWNGVGEPTEPSNIENRKGDDNA